MKRVIAYKNEYGQIFKTKEELLKHEKQRRESARALSSLTCEPIGEELSTEQKFKVVHWHLKRLYCLETQ